MGGVGSVSVNTVSTQMYKLSAKAGMSLHPPLPGLPQTHTHHTHTHTHSHTHPHTRNNAYWQGHSIHGEDKNFSDTTRGGGKDQIIEMKVFNEKIYNSFYICIIINYQSWTLVVFLCFFH